jgi:hypothetical protein
LLHQIKSDQYFIFDNKDDDPHAGFPLNPRYNIMAALKFDEIT